jgi:hypothetical protein
MRLQPKTLLIARALLTASLSASASARVPDRMGDLAAGLNQTEARCAHVVEEYLCSAGGTLSVGKVVTIPMAPRTARAIDLAVGERNGGPVFLAADGRRLDRHGAGRIVRKVVKEAYGAAHLKVILEANELATLDNVSRAFLAGDARERTSSRPPAPGQEVGTPAPIACGEPG